MQTFTPRPASPWGLHARVSAVVIAVFLSVLGGSFVGGPSMAAEVEAAWDVATVDGAFGSERPNFDYAVEPGDELEDRVTVVNNGVTPIKLVLYAADAFTTDSGQLDLRTRDRQPTSVGAWLRVEQDQISLQPGESAEVPFTVSVPSDATQGDHLGGIVTAPASASASVSSSTVPEVRVAIRVNLRVGESFQPSLAVDDLKVDFTGDPLGAGRAIVTYTIRNTGDTMLAAEQSVVVAGPFDSFRVSADPVEQSPRLLPNETWRVSVPVDGVASSGLLTATVTIVPLYTDPAGSTGPLAASDHAGQGWAVPWLPLLVVLVLVALVAVVILRYRRTASKATPWPRVGLAAR